VKMTELRQQLLADGEYFKHMLNLIPGAYSTDSVENNIASSERHIRSSAASQLTYFLSYSS